MNNEQRNKHEKARRERIKNGKHYKDKKKQSNQREYDCTFEAINSLLSQQHPRNDLGMIADLITELAEGERDEFTDSCSFCGVNKGRNFFDQMINTKLSCYSCKCKHISMVTKQQAIQKFPILEKHPKIFITLKRFGRYASIKRHSIYAVKDIYFTIDDIKAADNKIQG
eukprot:501874_1